MNSNFKTKYFGDKAFYRIVLAIAVPILIQTILTNLVGLLDNVMVGRLGTDEMTGVAVVNQLMFVFNLLVFGGMSAAGIFSTQYFGQNNHKGARDVFRIKLIIGIIILAISLLVFLLLYPQLIGAFLHEGGDSGDIVATFNYAKKYLFIMLIGIPPLILSNCYSTTLKEDEQTFMPMVAGVAAVVVDLVFNYLLIFGKFGFPELGVQGAAIATAMSRYVECFILVIYTHTHSQVYQFIIGAYKSVKVPASLVKGVIVKGTPLLINEFLWSFGLTLQSQAFSTRGLAAMGAMNINLTLSNVFNVVFVIGGSTTAILVGQALGAGDVKKARLINTRMSMFSVLTSLGASAMLILIAPFFPLIYNTTSEIQHLATKFIIVFAAVSPFNAFTNVTYFTLRSGGKTLITMLFDSFFIWMVNVPVSMCLAHFTSLPVFTIFLTVNVLEASRCVIGYFLVKYSDWAKTIIE